MAERDQNEGSGQQAPIGQQDEDRTTGQQDQQQFGQQGQQQPTGQGGQQPLGQQGNFGTQEPGLGGQGQQDFGRPETTTLNEGSQPGLGGGSTGEGGKGSNFVGSQGQDSGEYLQQTGNPESGFAEQGRGASNDTDIEGGGERSENRDSDIEGSSDNG